MMKNYQWALVTLVLGLPLFASLTKNPIGITIAIIWGMMGWGWAIQLHEEYEES